MSECIVGHAYSHSEWVDIGHGVSIELRYADDVLGGVAYRHPASDGMQCEGYANIAGRPFHEGWNVVSLDPLTLSPSLLCTACGHHGHIVDGKWVPA
jgi:hypothetical protein